MKHHFTQFIEDSRAVASSKDIEWEIRLDRHGLALDRRGWDLSAISGQSPPPSFNLRCLGTDRRTVESLQSVDVNLNRLPSRAVTLRQLSPAWQDLVKATVIDQLLIRRNTPEHALQNTARPLRVLATCAIDREPWELTIDDVSLAFSTAKLIQPSGKLADLVFGVVEGILDLNHLTDAGPLSPALTRSKHYHGKRAKFVKSVEELRSSLEDRSHAEKLPERRAFWELVRIVFTEKPKTFLHALLFAQVRVILLTGLRVGEAALLPADWKREREYYDRRGRPAGESGGYSRSLLLRHFAEKNRTADEDSLALFETAQHIPHIFEDVLTETLDSVTVLTAPLRRTLQRQIETGRILPDFEKNELVPLVRLYPYLTGNPFLLNFPEEQLAAFNGDHLCDYKIEFFNELYEKQLRRLAEPSLGPTKLNTAAYVYFHRLRGVTFRTSAGAVYPKHKRYDSTAVHVRVADVEEYLRSALGSKLSDSTPLKLADGQFAAFDLLFLAPKRAISEGRNDGLCDISRYYAVGRIDSSMITHSISRGGGPTLFSVYGQTEEDRRLTLNPHSLRHLQSTELFRLGVADTIITKRYNRRSVAQSYVYDHRTLAEELAPLDLPDQALTIALGPKTSTLARLIQAGKASGPIIDAFRRVQVSEGEASAFDYLRAEADGFHATPYGYCVNSFTVDPCPQHLECFNGCRNLVATNLPEHRNNLVQIESKLSVTIQAIEARPSRSIGRENQLEHARIRLSGIQKLLAAPTGTPAFPDGADLSCEGAVRRTVLDAPE